MKSLTKAAVTSIAALSLVLAGAVLPAQASEDEAELAVRTVAAVAPSQGEILSPDLSSDGSAVAESGTATVALPSNPDGDVRVQSSELGELSIPLPDVAEASQIQLGSDGSAVYSAAGHEDVTVVVQVMSDEAVRVQTISASPAAPTRFVYDFDGSMTPMIDEDGNVVVVDMSNPEGAAALSVDEPWAFDASGAPVATWYEVDGGSLVQHIAPSADVHYPIVADPRWEWQSWGYGMALNKAETREVAKHAGAAFMCAFFGPAAPACGIIAGSVAYSAGVAAANGRCVFLQVAPAPIAWQYSGGYCR